MTGSGVTHHVGAERKMVGYASLTHPICKNHVLVKTHFTSRLNLIRPFNPSRENNPLAPSGKSVAFLRASRTL
jgi:hypothetical protein